MRALVRIWVALLALVAIAIGAVLLNARRLIKQAVEREATRSLRLETRVASASVSLLGGKLGLHGLSIASPSSFSAPHMLELGSLDVDVSYTELRRRPIHIDSIAIDHATLIIEQAGGALNLRKAVEALPASPPGKQPMMVIIDELKLADARVLVRPGVPGLDREIAVAVPPLTLRDIGRGRGERNGAALKDVAMRVISALAAKAAQSEALPAGVRAVLRLDAANVASALGAEAQKRLEQAIPAEVGSAVSGALPRDEAAKQVQGLLRGSDAKSSGKAAQRRHPR